MNCQSFTLIDTVQKGPREYGPSRIEHCKTKIECPGSEDYKDTIIVECPAHQECKDWLELWEEVYICVQSPGPCTTYLFRIIPFKKEGTECGECKIHEGSTCGCPNYPIPVITSPANLTVTAGVSLAYNVTATNAPKSYSAVGLPEGLSINKNTGKITGAPNASGFYLVTISAINLSGIGTATLSITVNPPIEGGRLTIAALNNPLTYNILACNKPTNNTYLESELTSSQCKLRVIGKIEVNGESELYSEQLNGTIRLINPITGFITSNIIVTNGRFSYLIYTKNRNQSNRFDNETISYGPFEIYSSNITGPDGLEIFASGSKASENAPAINWQVNNDILVVPSGNQICYCTQCQDPSIISAYSTCSECPDITNPACNLLSATAILLQQITANTCTWKLNVTIDGNISPQGSVYTRIVYSDGQVGPSRTVTSPSWTEVLLSANRFQDSATYNLPRVEIYYSQTNGVVNGQTIPLFFSQYPYVIGGYPTQVSCPCLSC